MQLGFAPLIAMIGSDNRPDARLILLLLVVMGVLIAEVVIRFRERYAGAWRSGFWSPVVGRDVASSEQAIVLRFAIAAVLVGLAAWAYILPSLEVSRSGETIHQVVEIAQDVR